MGVNASHNDEVIGHLWVGEKINVLSVAEIQVDPASLVVGQMSSAALELMTTNVHAVDAWTLGK